MGISQERSARRLIESDRQIDDLFEGEPARASADEDWSPAPGPASERGLAEAQIGYRARVSGCLPPHMPRAIVDRLIADDETGTVEEADFMALLLCLCAPHADCQALARRALRVFGSVQATLAARVPRITMELDLEADAARALKAFHVGIRSLLQEPIRKRVSIGSQRDLTEYLQYMMGHEDAEVLRALYLDTRNGLIEDELVHRGTINHVPLYPREIVRRALERNAAALIIAHNHPSGAPQPSRTDIEMTRAVQAALKVMDIALHDHVIIGRGQSISFRSMGLL